MRHLPLALLLLLLLPHTTAQCLPSQSAALLRLKQHFNFTHRSASNLTSWIPAIDCCSWEGVACATFSSGMVTVLDLSNLSIAGKLDISLFNLTALVSLNLAYNNFNPSPFPQSFNLLPKLTHLNLSNAGFTGQIPASIASLTSLVSLDLSTFYLEEIPSNSLKLHDPDLRKLIKNLRDLRELYLDGVNISANGTEWGRAVAESAPGLQELSLVGCSLSGPIDTSLAKLQSLQLLRLNQNNLNCGVPDFVGNFTALRQLSLSSCKLEGVIPDTIFKIGGLIVLDISYNPALSGLLPEFKNSALESLVLSNTNLSGSLPESIGRLSSLAQMELSNCSFSGQLPHTMGNLTKLTNLDLSFNNFSGEIPSVLLWERIVKVALANNSLNGSIPVSLGNKLLQKLTQIDIRNNLLTGSIPSTLFSLPSLHVLQLNQNRLSGQIRKFLNPSPMLHIVDFSDNNLQGEIPSSVFNLSGLSILGLSSNNFSGTIDLSLFASLQNLTSLDISNNRLSVATSESTGSIPKLGTLRLAACNLTSIPSFLRNQTEISNLDLSNNRISGFIHSWIWGSPNLIYLNLSFNFFTDVERPLPELSNTTPPIILDLHSNKLQGPILLPPKNTIVLDYSNNNFTSNIPVNISHYLKFTSFFSLSNNTLTGAIPPSICKANNLIVLDLSLNKLSSSIPSCLLGNISTLQVLNLRDNRLSGTIPNANPQQCSLRTVNLNDNQLRGKLPLTLVNCTMIEVLDIGNNHFHDSFPHWLSSLSQLQVLVLSTNSFYGAISDTNFPMLQIFDISSNKFSGTLSSGYFNSFKSMMDSDLLTVSRRALGISYLRFSGLRLYQDTVTVTYKGQEMTLVNALTVFTYIDLSDNGFVGEIPQAIGELTSLVMLNMSHNFFTERIPSSLGRLVELESLDLSSNRLTGEIPQELLNLYFLAVLNLSYNELVGKIPQGGQLSTFDRSAFEGNDGLCGVPLAKLCSIVLPHNVPRFSMVTAGSRPSWEFVVVGVGIGAGLAVVLGGLRVCDEWRRLFEEWVDWVMWAVIELVGGCCGGRVKVSAAEGEEELRRKYCVFCTISEVRHGVAAVRHRECRCPKGGP